MKNVAELVVEDPVLKMESCAGLEVLSGPEVVGVPLGCVQRFCHGVRLLPMNVEACQWNDGYWYIHVRLDR